MCLQVIPHKDATGKIDGLIKEIGQTKVDRTQAGERKALRCRSDCDGELAVDEDGKVDGARACPVELLLSTKTLIERQLGLAAGVELEEAVFADYCLREKPPRGATVVAVDADSDLYSVQFKEEAICIITKAQDVKGERHQRGDELLVTSADGETLKSVSPNPKGMWFEVPGKPYLVRPWTSSSEVVRRLRMLAVIAQRQARKAGVEQPFGNAFKVSDFKGWLASKTMRRTMVSRHVAGEVAPMTTMKQGKWSKMSTMMKYAEDTDPFAAGGVNLTDVVLRGKKATESPSDTATLSELRAQVQAYEEEVLMLRRLLAANAIEAPPRCTMASSAELALAEGAMAEVALTDRLVAEALAQAPAMAAHVEASDTAMHKAGPAMAAHVEASEKATRKAGEKATRAAMAGSNEAAEAHKETKQQRNALEPCGCKKSLIGASGIEAAESAMEAAPSGLPPKELQDWLCLHEVHVQRSEAAKLSRKRRLSRRKEMKESMAAAQVMVGQTIDQNANELGNVLGLGINIADALEQLDLFEDEAPASEEASVQVFVKDTHSHSFMFKLSATLVEVKAAIAAAGLMTVERQWLRFKGVTMGEEEQALAAYGVAKNDTLQLSPRRALTGGMQAASSGSGGSSSVEAAEVAAAALFEDEGDLALVTDDEATAAAATASDREYLLSDVEVTDVEVVDAEVTVKVEAEEEAEPVPEAERRRERRRKRREPVREDVDLTLTTDDDGELHTQKEEWEAAAARKAARVAKRAETERLEAEAKRLEAERAKAAREQAGREAAAREAAARETAAATAARATEAINAAPDAEMIWESKLVRQAAAEGELSRFALNTVYRTDEPDLLALGAAMREEDFDEITRLLRKFEATVADDTFVDICHEHSEWYEIAREKHGGKPGAQTVFARCQDGGPHEQVSEWPTALLRAVREVTKMPLEMHVYKGQRLIYEPLGNAGARTDGGWYLVKGEPLEVVSYNATTRQLRARCPRLKDAMAWIPDETTHVDLSEASDGEFGACRLVGPPWRYEDIRTVYSAQGSQYVNVHVRMGKFKGRRNLPYTAVTRAIKQLKVSGVELDDGGCDVREKCELHAKSVLYQAGLGVGSFSAERIEQARLQVAQAGERSAAPAPALAAAAGTEEEPPPSIEMIEAQLQALYAKQPAAIAMDVRARHERLDESQRRALHGAVVECKRVCLISGPAGAGKSDQLWFMCKVLGKDNVGVMAPTRGATRANQATVDKALPRRSFKPELEVLTTYGGVGVGFKETFDAPTIAAAIKRKDAKKAKAAAMLKKKVMVLDEAAQTLYTHVDTAVEVARLLGHSPRRWVMFMDPLQTPPVVDARRV